MKQLLPSLLLFAAGLGCAIPGPSKFGINTPNTIAKSAPHPTIQYSKPRWSNEGNVSLLLSFEVKNTAGKTLEFIKTDASFYDKSGNFIRSEFMYIDRYQSLGPGDKSAAKVQVDYDPRIKSAQLHFSCHGDDPFSTDDIDATEVAKVQ